MGAFGEKFVLLVEPFALYVGLKVYLCWNIATFENVKPTDL